MQTIKCRNENCETEIEFDLSELNIEDSEKSQTQTQYSASGEIECEKCGTTTQINCVWNQLDDTDEILRIDFT